MGASALRAEQPQDGGALLGAYVELLHAVERAQRQLHDTVAAELERSGVADVTAVQAMLLFHLGEERLTAAEIMHSGRYLGSNVSYNLKKLNDAGRLDCVRDTRGNPRFAATAAGRAIQSLLWNLFARQTDALAPVCGLDHTGIGAAEASLKKLERYWSDQVRFRL